MSLSPELYSRESDLADLLWEHSPQVGSARAAVATAESDVTRAYLFPNPESDFGWGTIPVGGTNPAHLHDPLGNVPNYSAAIGELVELGKRGPRQGAAHEDLERTRAEAIAVLGDRFFALLARIGGIAIGQQRAAVFEEQVHDSEQLLQLDRARASKGEIAALDVDVVEVEHERVVAARDAALSDVAAAQGDCSAIISMPCQLFDSGASATAFLDAAIRLDLPRQWSSEAETRRPDVRALDAAARAAEQRLTLANRKIVPDVTLRLGYTYDEFIVSGNQRNSLAVGLHVPLPVLDRGQADSMAARAEQERARHLRETLVAVAPEQVAAVIRRRDLVLSRIERLDSALEKARSVHDALANALRAGGTSLIEVLLARRSYQDLLRERLDLDGEGFEAALNLRQALALFPRPTAAVKSADNP